MVKPSDTILIMKDEQNSRPQRTVNADVASLHATPVAETVYNARRQQELPEMSLIQGLSPEKPSVSGGETPPRRLTL
jgi:hypothetical protein